MRGLQEWLLIIPARDWPINNGSQITLLRCLRSVVSDCNWRIEKVIAKKIGATCLAFVFILLTTGPARAGQPVKEFNHADAINDFIHKEYTLSSGGGYVLHVDLETRVMNYKGKKARSDFRIPYNSAFETVTIDKAFTTLPSGKILRVDPREVQDILDPATADSSIFSKAKLKVVNFPGVEVGSKISISYTVNSRLNFWAEESFRLSDPTLQKQVVISVPGNDTDTAALTVSLHDEKVKFHKQVKQGKTIYSWTAKDLPKQYSEAQSPEIQNQPFCLLVSGFSSWSEVASFFKRRFDIPRQTESIRLPSWALEHDADRLYENLLNNIAVYEIDLFKTDLSPQPPMATLKKGYGSSLDVAILFHFLLKHQGIRSSLVLTNTDGVFIEPLMDSFYPALFNQVLVRSGGRFYCFVDRNMPPGVNEADGNLGLDLAQGRLVKISAASPNQREIRLAVHLSPELGLRGRCTLTFQGLSTADVRDELLTVSGRELEIKVSEILHDVDPIARLTGKFESKGISRLKRNIELSFPFAIGTSAAYSADSYFFPLPGSDLLDPMSAYIPERHYAFAIPTTRQEITDLELRLPPGVKLVLYPKESKGHFGPLSWEIKSQISGDHYSFYRSITLQRALVPATEVPELLQKICELVSIQNRLLAFNRGRL